jgi:hypothetical protein
MKIFGDVDRTRDGKPKSEYPSWYFNQQKDELEEGIAQKERALEQELVPVGEERNRMKNKLLHEKKRMDDINESQPKPTEKELAELTKMRKELGGMIKDAMFTRSQMEKGLADAHDEARRMSTPCIELKDEQIPFAKGCDVPISHNGKVTRKGAEKMWKIASRLLGEQSNTETLRKD